MANLVVDEEDFSALIEDDFEFAAEKLENYDILSETDQQENLELFDDNIFKGIDGNVGCKDELEGDDFSVGQFSIDNESLAGDTGDMDDLFDLGGEEMEIKDDSDIDFEALLSENDENSFNTSLEKFEWDDQETDKQQKRHFD